MKKEKKEKRGRIRHSPNISICIAEKGRIIRATCSAFKKKKSTRCVPC